MNASWIGTHRMGSRVWILCAMVCLLGVLAPQIARGQDLAKENEELKAKIAKLEADKESLQKRVIELNEALIKLQRHVGAPSTGGSPADGATGGSAGGKPTADPMSSPDALLEHLKADYAEKFGGMARDSRSEQSKYQREVAGWTRSVQRERRGAIEWNIKLLNPAKAMERPGVLEFEVVDGAGRARSKPASALLPARWARDIAAAKQGDIWKISAVFSAQPKFDESRETDGAANQPVLIGPYAEFGFELAITRLESAN